MTPKPVLKAFDTIVEYLTSQLPAHVTPKYSGVMSARECIQRDMRAAIERIRSDLEKLNAK